MIKRDFYAILGVPLRAEAGEIKRAYRRLAFSLHPDVGQHPDPERFNEVREAYDVLSNPEQRRAYDVKVVGSRQPLSAEPLRAGRPVAIFDDHLTLRPSIEELMDHISQNFFGYRKKSAGPYRRLGMQAILEPEEARFGCRLPLRIPCYAECPECEGVGQTWGWGICPGCRGIGQLETVREVTLEIPPGTRDGEHHQVDLGSVGINNLMLEIRVAVL
jgi:molecular chaperone DnaJ